MKKASAEIIREYGPFPGVEKVNGVTYDGRHAWFASGDKLNALDPESGTTVRSIDVAAITCFSCLAIAFRRSIRKPAGCSTRFPLRAAPVQD